MAFVFQTKRKVNQVSKLTNPTGPGQYFKQQSNSKHQACAPFNSTGMRRTLFDQKKQIKVGPGQYDIANNIIEPNIKTVSNSHSIIVKINSTGTSEFKSAKQRFGDDSTFVPGPGAYKCQDLKSSRRRSPMSSPSSSNTMKKFKALTQSLKKYPTIPDKVRGLTDTKNEQEVPDAQKLGPAHYNPDKKKYLNLTSAVWGKDKTRRFSQDLLNQVGPGKYKLELNKISTVDQPTGTFKSATVRTYFQSLYYKTNLNQTARERDRIHFKTKDPAPGQYEVNKSSFEVKQKPFSFQFFGSTVQRFPQQYQGKSQKPKSSSFYNVGSSLGKFKSFNRGNHGFDSESARKPQFLRIQQTHTKNPGPGHYKQKIVVQKKLRGINVQRFGSTTQRPFHRKQQADEVGPGKYFVQHQNEQDQIMKNKFGQLKQFTSNFKSTTERNCFGQTKNNVPLGQYQVTNNDISKRIQKQRNYLQNLKKIQVQKAPFQSTHSRFPHYEEKSKQKVTKKINLDDINKEHQIKIRQQAEKVRSTIIEFNKSQLKQHEVKGNFGNSSRFSDNKKGAPGVGQYSLTNGFEKKTYNVKYTGNQGK